MDELRSHMKLRFDPLGSDAGEHLHDIFGDALGRNLYLGIRQAHIVGEDFTQKCLSLVHRIRERGIPQSVEDLQASLRLVGDSAGCYDGKEFVEKLLPYARCEKNITYEVVRKE